MPRVGVEPTIPEFETAKTVHALDRAATVIGTWAGTKAEIEIKLTQDLEFNDAGDNTTVHVRDFTVSYHEISSVTVAQNCGKSKDKIVLVLNELGRH
jgi:hypothetical protein